MINSSKTLRNVVASENKKNNDEVLEMNLEKNEKVL